MKAQFKILILSLLFLIGCKKVDKLTQFDMEYNTTVTIPSSTGINLPFNILTPDITTNSESTFAVNDTRKDLIQQINLKTLNLTIKSPSNGDFSFLKSVSIYLSAEGLSEIKIAWKDNVPENVGSTLSLDVSSNDFKEYIKKDKFTLRLNSVTDKLLATDYQVNINAVFFVDAKLIK